MGDKYILWIVCTCTRFIQGGVLNDKKPESIVKALHRGWCLLYGYPTVRFWSDNGGEFRNSKMKEFVNKLGLEIKFTNWLKWIEICINSLSNNSSVFKLDLPSLSICGLETASCFTSSAAPITCTFSTSINIEQLTLVWN